MLNLKKNNGFTMVELLATFVILGIIMAITIPTISYFLKGNSKDYYSKLERTVASSSQDFFNDYRVNLPKDIGNVKKIGIPTLVSQKYITDVLGIDKKSCEGDVVVQKLTNGNYSYTSCLKCEKKADGSYGYVSDFKECGYSEENNNHYTILINGLGDKTSIRIPQAVSYNIPNAKVYVNGQALSNDLRPTPGTIDVNNLTTYKIYYTFRTLVKELQIKVYDPKKPVMANITATANSTNYSSGTYTNKDVKVSLSATDWTTSTVYGSGIDHFEYQINGGSAQKISATTSDNRNYTATFNLTTNGTYNISAKAIDKEGNISDSKTFVVKIDKTTPTAPVITGGSTTWTNQNRTIKIQKDATVPSGVKNYQYYISTSENSQTGGSWINLAAGVKQVVISTEGTRYIFFRAISNSGVEGLVSNKETTRIDKSKPTAPVITGGSTTWTNQNRTIKVSTDATVPSGIKNYQYYISTSENSQTGGSWINLSAGVKQVVISTEGTRYIYFRAISNSGVVGLVSNKETTRIDKSTPTAPVITGGSTTWTNQNRTIKVTTESKATSGIKNYQYYISTSSTAQSGGSWINLSSGVKQVAISTEGTRYIYFRAISNNGITSAVSNRETTAIDKTNPVITSVDGTNKWISSSTKVTINATDNISGLRAYTFDNGSSWYKWEPGAAWWRFDKSQSISLGVKDVAGNTTYQTHNIKVDTTAPTVNYTPPSTWTNQNRTLTIPVSDTESGIAKMQWGKGVYKEETNSYTCNNTSYEFNNTFTTDVHVNCARITDNVGNVTTVWIHSKVDKIPPYTPWFNAEAIEKNKNNGYNLICKSNKENYYGINECILEHTQPNGGYYISKKDMGGSGHGYEEIKDLYKGTVLKDWTRYKYGSTPPDLSFSKYGQCKKEGDCVRWYRTIDNAGNVASGYLIMHYVNNY